MISFFKTWWKKNSMSGVLASDLYAERRRQMMTNHVNVAVIIISLLLLIVDTLEKLSRDALFYSDDLNHELGIGYRFIVAIMLAVINIFLSDTRYKKLGRIILVFGVSYAYLILPLQIGHVYNELYLWYPYAGIPFIVLPVMLFDHQKEKLLHYGAMIYLMVFPLFSAELLNFFADRTLEMQEIVSIHSVFYRVAPTAISLFAIVCIHYLILLTDKNARKLDDKNKKLNDTLGELQRTQNHLIKNEKMAIVGRMSSELTHEINTPISAIKANLTLLAYDQKHRLQLLHKIGKSGSLEELEQLGQMVRDMHENARINDKREEHTSLTRTEVEAQFDAAQITGPFKDAWIDCLAEVGLLNPRPYSLLYNSPLSEEIIDFLIGEFQQRQSFKISRTAISQAEKLILKLKSYSYSKDLSEVRPFNLAAIIYNSVDLLESKMKQIECELDLQQSLPLVVGQPDEILQVINNLLINAMQAMDYKGKLTIRLIGNKEDQQVIIEDTGGGIFIESDEDIFEAFFTTKKQGEGTGLGLHICRQIIEKHKGSIEWANTNQGARFIVTLPASLQIEYH